MPPRKVAKKAAIPNSEPSQTVEPRKSNGDRLEGISDWLYSGISWTPFALATVCQLWRAAALSMPELWSTIGFRADPGEGCVLTEDEKPLFEDVEELAEERRDMLEMFINRSGSLPLKISIAALSWGFSEALMTSFFAVCPRISHLDLRGRWISGLSLEDEELANLEALTITSESPDDPQAGDYFYFATRVSVSGCGWLESAQKMEHVEVKGFASVRLNSIFWENLPKGNIATLIVDRCNFRNLECFVDYPRLWEAHLQLLPATFGGTVNGEARTNARRLVLSSLGATNALEIVFRNVTSLFLECLELDAAKDIKTEPESNRQPVDWSRLHQIFVGFAARSGLAQTLIVLRLEAIQVKGCPSDSSAKVNEVDLDEIFRSLPALIRISLLESNRPFTIFTKQSIRSLLDFSVLPALKQLDIRFRADTSNDARFDALAELVKARSSGGPGPALEDLWVAFGESIGS
ncbi:hypothetical protein C8J56DRAFT_1084628 [Mycena floridula]|nr:hypothetical protein C8J56DRAFT_1084628 [Mycena floridula]